MLVCVRFVVGIKKTHVCILSDRGEIALMETTGLCVWWGVRSQCGGVCKKKKKVVLITSVIAKCLLLIERLKGCISMPAFTEHLRMLGYLCVCVNVWSCCMTDCKLISYLRSLPAWMLLSHAWLHVLCLCLCISVFLLVYVVGSVPQRSVCLLAWLFSFSSMIRLRPHSDGI